MPTPEWRFLMLKGHGETRHLLAPPHHHQLATGTNTNMADGAQLNQKVDGEPGPFGHVGMLYDGACKIMTCAPFDDTTVGESI